jgi:hypothetical protein
MDTLRVTLNTKQNLILRNTPEKIFGFRTEGHQSIFHCMADVIEAAGSELGRILHKWT